MKISVSLPPLDVELLDTYAHAHALGSRSATIQHAIDLLRQVELADAYEEAWDEWDGSGESPLWDAVGADGLQPR